VRGLTYQEVLNSRSNKEGIFSNNPMPHTETLEFPGSLIGRNNLIKRRREVRLDKAGREATHIPSRGARVKASKGLGVTA